MNVLILTFSALLSTFPTAPACTCGAFARIPDKSWQAGPVLTPEAVTIRNFALFSHRKIAEDLMQKQGPYLATVLDYFSSCKDRSIKTEWLKEILLSSSDTTRFADQLAEMTEHELRCLQQIPQAEQ